MLAYRIKLSSEEGWHTKETYDAICKHISNCQEYINIGNKINEAWMEENHLVLTKAVKYAHFQMHHPWVSDEAGHNIDEEHQDLHKCIIFYKNLYARNGIDFETIPV